MRCPHAEIVSDGKSVVCSVILELVGMRCGMDLSNCARCKYPDDKLLTKTIAKRHIKNLVISGNQPKFANSIDVPAMAARFKQMSTEKERVDVIEKAIAAQCIPEEKGGHCAATIEKNLRDLELALGLSNTLEGII